PDPWTDKLPHCIVYPQDASLGALLRDLVGNRGRRLDLAARGRPFVADVHDAAAVAEQLVGVYRQPQAPVRSRAMPDWISNAPAGRIEHLEARLDRAEAELGRSRLREAELRARYGVTDGRVDPLLRRVARRILPAGLRRRLRGYKS
ncbi:MAG: hypothetical protein WCK58_17760, partial [Chloroflexota bacterium]